MTRRRAFSALFVLLAAHLAWPFDAGARTLHVDVKRGSDHNDGLTSEASFQTIQHAADLVEPGDEVIIHPGVYFERVAVREKLGTEEKPIVFRADRVARNRVILTSANRKIRSGTATWTLEDEERGLYSTSYYGEMPSRVLYSGIDHYPYATLEQLRSFTTESGPAPRHGYHYDQERGKLYLRLHDSGRYGPVDPARHTISIAPAEGHGIQILGKGDAHIVIAGITFEAPGNSAVFTEASFVEVRRCWFVGCPYGVRGTRRSLAPEDGQDNSASNITIAYCDFSEFPAFDDAEELLQRADLSSKRRGTWAHVWHRKTSGRLGLPADRKNYENGIAALIGHNWRIHHNYIHDAFEGLANDGVTRSTDLHVHDNVFARLCDNGIEVENHARDAHICRNLFLDVFEPFSFQPLSGPPWPGPVYFYQNVIANSADHAELWRFAAPNNRGVFKVGISLKNWRDGRNATVPKSPLGVPAPGLLIFNNTVYFPGGRLITRLGSRDVPINGVQFVNNLLVTDTAMSSGLKVGLRPGHFEFRNNLVIGPESPMGVEESRLNAGEHGEVLSDVAEIGWRNVLDQNFALTPESQANRRSEPIDGAPALFPVIGAIQPGSSWYPPQVGPDAK